MKTKPIFEDVEVKESERPLSQYEKDLIDHYTWAVRHHLELAKSFTTKVEDIRKNGTETPKDYEESI